MISTLQQINSTPEESKLPFCKKLKSYISSYVFGLLFVVTALIFAVIYTGFGINRHRPNVTNPSYVILRHDQINHGAFKLSDTKKYPFIGALVSERPYILLCTVVILTNRYLLTSANCFTTYFPNLHVRVGSNLWDANGREYEVEKFLINEAFNVKTMEGDIALLKVKQIIAMGENVKAANISNLINGDRGGTVLGWNFLGIAERRNVSLVEQELFIWNSTSCSKYSGNQNGNLICASLNNNLCKLGITGPLIVNNEVVGFWSWGLSCLNVPSIFTNLDYFRKWIQYQISLD